MTDKQIIIYKKECYNEPYCSLNQVLEQLKRKEQECEELKEEIKNHNDDMFKNPPEKRFYCKGCTLPYISKKLKQALTDIKEIAEKLKNFYEELGKCEDLTVVRLKQILQKISECEGNDGL